MEKESRGRWVIRMAWKSEVSPSDGLTFSSVPWLGAMIFLKNRAVNLHFTGPGTCQPKASQQRSLMFQLNQVHQDVTMCREVCLFSFFMLLRGGFTVGMSFEKCLDRIVQYWVSY